MRDATSVLLERSPVAYSRISQPDIPEATPAPMMAPMDDPEMATGLIPSSSSASMTWICASPRAPPPPNANATLGVEVISLRFLQTTDVTRCLPARSLVRQAPPTATWPQQPSPRQV